MLLMHQITKADSSSNFCLCRWNGEGWTSVQTSNIADNQNPFMVATGGTDYLLW